MMYATYALSRIVKTASPTVYTYIWDDLYEENHEPTWTGWFRGVVSGWNDLGEFSRYDNKDAVMRFASGIEVVGIFIDQGGVVEDYFEPVAPIDEPVALEE